MTESYELEDATGFSQDLEQQRLVQPGDDDNASSQNEESDTESTTSGLFDDLNRVSGNNQEDFQNSETFLQKYREIIGPGKTRKWYFIGGGFIIVVVLAVWIYTLLSGFDYNEGSSKDTSPSTTEKIVDASPTTLIESSTLLSIPSSSISTISSISSISSISTTSTHSIIPLKENDIHKSREEIPINTHDSQIINTAVQFIPGHNIAKKDDEGFYIQQDNDNFILKKLVAPTFEEVIYKTSKFKYQNTEFTISSFIPNYDMTYALLVTNIDNEFRHSFKAYYWLYEISTSSITPILADDAESKLQHASWSHNFNYITYIQDNNLYLFDVSTKKFKQLTNDGSENIFNGKPDWVYEEEVLGSDHSFWWSPDDKYIAYVKIDDTKVETLNLEFYDSVKYPRINKIKYPKPGDHNPLLTIHIYDLSTGETSQIDRSDSELGIDFVLYGLIWLDEKNLILKESDRQSNILNYRSFNIDSSSSKVIYKQNVYEDYDGWVDNWGYMLKIDKNDTINRKAGFVDVLSNEGYNHLAYFTLDSDLSNPPIFLTKGDWEVTTGSLAFDNEENLVYFNGNRKSPFEQHVYTVHLETKELSAIESVKKLGFYTAYFSPSTRFIILEFEGPSFPILYKQDTLIKKTIEKRSLDFTGSRRTYHNIQIGIDEQGDPINVNLIEMRPENFDENKKYPVLVNIYGGPGSQKTDVKYHVTFEDIISDELNSLVLYIDPRGTTGQGWKYRSWSKRNIGKYEGHDITTATKNWINSRTYINEDKVAIWGWSYGGFSTLKTLEFDKGETFKFGMAVAPVTNWRYYDSIYTERYMGIPDNNKNGYDTARINDIDSFKSVKRFLIMHGTGDDNVHIGNTFNLLDQFNLHSVENYELRIFPDSNHNINRHNAYNMVMSKLKSWLNDAFNGKYD